jgi:hypothetical protein
MNDSSPAEIDLLVSDNHELPGGTHVAEGELGDGLALHQCLAACVLPPVHHP